MEYDVFISYARKDYVDENNKVIPGNIVSKIKHLFDANDITYWFDENGVFSGDAFASVIAQSIRSSKIFLFISSENSNASIWTSNEIATAHAYKKKIIPFKFDDSVYNESIIIYIASLDFIEYKIGENKSLSRLLDSVNDFLSKEKEELRKLEMQQNEEKARQQRAEDLRMCRENICKLNQQKDEIEDEVVAMESQVNKLRLRIQSIDLQLEKLHEEERVLGGMSQTGSYLSNDKSLLEQMISGEWETVRNTFAQRHWLLNTVVVLLFVIFAFAGILALHLALKKPGFTLIFSSLTAASSVGFVGIYRLMKNCKDSLYWLTPLGIVFLPILVILYPLMFLKRNKVSAWKLLSPSQVSLKDDILYVVLIFVFIVGVLGVCLLCIG